MNPDGYIERKFLMKVKHPKDRAERRRLREAKDKPYVKAKKVKENGYPYPYDEHIREQYQGSDSYVVTRLEQDPG